MFKFMKNLFKKRSDVKDLSKETSITFAIDEAGENIYISVNVRDYTEQDARNLAKIILSFSGVDIHLSALETIKSGFLALGTPDLYNVFANEMVDIIEDDNELLKNNSGQQEEEGPCIKPSDML